MYFFSLCKGRVPGVAGVDGVANPEFSADGLLDGVEEKITASTSTASVCAAVEFVSVWKSTIWAVLSLVGDLAHSMVFISPY